MITKKRIGFFSILIILFFAGCSISGGVGELAGEYADSYLEKFKNGDYEGMHEMLDSETARKTPRGAYILWYKDIVAKRGCIKTYKNMSMRTHPSKDGMEITLSYDIYFAKGKATFNIMILKKGSNFSVLHTMISQFR